MDFSEPYESEVVGFISKESILSCYKEEEIFELVFGFKPIEYQYITSPFRHDDNPGCWFERSLHNDKLLFMDYGDPLFNRQDCFSCVKRYFKLPNFYQTLLFIKEKLSEKIPTDRVFIKEEFVPVEKKRVEIYIKPRNFIQSDKFVWFKYGITRKQLIEDAVIPVTKYVLTNTRKGTIKATVYTNCYSFSEFEDNRKKLYFPFNTGKKRFITNCTQNDIGGLKTLKKSKQLVITKSYKDCRVLRNLGINCLWFQNEGMIPDKELLESILIDFKEIIIFFDNDETGLLAGDKVVDFIKQLKIKGKVRKIFLPTELLQESVKDSSDCYYYKGQEFLIEFLTKNKVNLC